MEAAPKLDLDGEHLSRVRRICFALLGCEEKTSHGEPTFFVRKRVFVMFANNHHNDGHVAIWIPAEKGVRALLVRSAPEVYYTPPYVGVKGWVGIELASIDDEQLSAHIVDAWRLIAPKSLSPTAGGAGRHHGRR